MNPRDVSDDQDAVQRVQIFVRHCGGSGSVEFALAEMNQVGLQFDWEEVEHVVKSE